MKRLQNMMSNLSKEKIITVICIFIAVVAIIISTLLFISARTANSDGPKDTADEPQVEDTQRITYPSDSPKSLEFQSLGDGCCIVVSIGGFSATELEIPEKSPAGETVIGIGSGAFEGCDELISVSIPYTVTTMGEGVFKGCSALVMISVDSGNSKFTSSGGILFTKNKTQLICYPANRTGSSYLLNPNVKIIASHAFYGIRNLSKINYEGDAAEFADIKIGDGNKTFSALPLTCNYNPAK